MFGSTNHLKKHPDEGNLLIEKFPHCVRIFDNLAENHSAVAVICSHLGRESKTPRRRKDFFPKDTN